VGGNNRYPLTRLLLVRHGSTIWNEAHRIQGHFDAPLSAEGIWQAQRLAQALAGEALDAIHTSSLSRAQITAREIARLHQVPVISEPALRERCYGLWEGLTPEEIARDYPEEARLWRAGDYEFAPPGGESLKDVLSRLARFFNDLLQAKRGQSLLLVSHANALSLALCCLLQRPLEERHALLPANASVSEVQIAGDKATLVRFNDLSHLKAMEPDPEPAPDD